MHPVIKGHVHLSGYEVMKHVTITSVIVALYPCTPKTLQKTDEQNTLHPQ